MFGQNPVAKNEVRLAGDTLRVVNGAPFYTIQGEGPYAGQAAVFLRLNGCPLRCHFCDTEFSSPHDPRLSVTEIANAIESCAPGWVRLLVITGGEPTRQNLAPLVETMIEDGWIVQIETAGMFWQDCLYDCVVVCSPKTPTIHEKILDNATVFKYVIQEGAVDPEDGLPLTNTQQANGKPHRLARPRPGAPVYLSPMDECDPERNAKNLFTAGQIALKHDYRVGVQLHKMLLLP